MTGPSPKVRKELERLLSADQTRLGQVYRLDQDGLDPPAIAAELGVKTSNFVVNNRTIARAFLDGTLPSGPVIRGVVAGAIRTRAKTQGLSNDARAYLMGVLEQLAPADERGASEQAPPASARSRAVGGNVTLRDQVDEELRRRTRELALAIRDATGIAAEDYHAVVSASFALDTVTRMVTRQSTGPTTKRLQSMGRLDLSLEQAVVDWAGDLPLATDIVDAAKGRLSYWRNG